MYLLAFPTFTARTVCFHVCILFRKFMTAFAMSFDSVMFSTARYLFPFGNDFFNLFLSPWGQQRIKSHHQADSAFAMNMQGIIKSFFIGSPILEFIEFTTNKFMYFFKWPHFLLRYRDRWRFAPHRKTCFTVHKSGQPVNICNI